MKRLSPAALIKIQVFETYREKLWDIAQGRDADRFDLGRLKRDALNFLKAVDDNDRWLYFPEYKAAATSASHTKLAVLILKLIRAYAGSDALDESLRLATDRHSFSQARAKVADDVLAEAWNRPGLDNLSDRNRATRLSKENYGTATSIERRASRMRKRGWKLNKKRLPPAGSTRSK
jgi:hypothetical protein